MAPITGRWRRVRPARERYPRQGAARHGEVESGETRMSTGKGRESLGQCRWRRYCRPRFGELRNRCGGQPLELSQTSLRSSSSTEEPWLAGQGPRWGVQEDLFTLTSRFVCFSCPDNQRCRKQQIKIGGDSSGPRPSPPHSSKALIMLTKAWPACIDSGLDRRLVDRSCGLVVGLNDICRSTQPRM